MSILCNLARIVLGLLAWTLPVVAMVRRKNAAGCCAGSFLLCSLSLLLQLVNMVYLCRIRDFSAVEDTVGAVALAAIVLVIGSMILNAIAALISKKQA